MTSDKLRERFSDMRLDMASVRIQASAAVNVARSMQVGHEPLARVVGILDDAYLRMCEELAREYLALVQWDRRMLHGDENAEATR